MNKLRTLKNRTKTLTKEQEVYRIGFEVIEKLEAYLIDLQQIQLESGRNNQNQPLGNYSKKTEALSRTNPPVMPKVAGQPYNFQWEGDFFRGMKLEIARASAVFTSIDPKFGLLEDKYPGLMGLTPESLGEAIKDKILPNFIKECRLLLTQLNS